MGCCESASGRPVESVQVQQLELGPSPLYAQRGTPFGELLEKGFLAVVRATYFDDCLDRCTPFQDRANIPAEALIDGDEVVDLWEEYGYAFLVVVSYPWLAREHPDPHRYHLARLVRALKAFRTYHEGTSWTGSMAERVREVGPGVIIDFCSLWQGGRTAEQEHAFKEGLSLIHIPYGHRDVTALKLTSTPPNHARQYDDRGWTHFESTIIDGKAPSQRHHWGERNVLTCDDTFEPHGDTGAMVLEECCSASRRPPLTPRRFFEEQEARRERAEAKGEPLFADRRDSCVVLDSYEASFVELCRSTKLEYYGMGWGAAEAKDLALALPSFESLEVLVLDSNRLDGEAAEMLAAALTRLPRLHTLGLSHNRLGQSPEAAEALAAALPSLPALQALDLSWNGLGKSAQAELYRAWRAAGKEGGLSF